MDWIILIGNSIYEDSEFETLEGIYSDIETMERIFSRIGYKVEKCVDFTYDMLKSKLMELEAYILDNDNVIIYYSGHGFHKGGHNFVTVKDSRSTFQSRYDSESYQMFCKVFDVENYINLSRCNKRGNTMVIIDACRIKKQEDFKILKEAEVETNEVWQLYSTSLGKTSHDNGLFVKAFEEVIYRQGQNVEELYESIRCFYENNCIEKYKQLPILISGKSNFVIVNELNEVIEEKYYSDLMCIYYEVGKAKENYECPDSEDSISEMTELLVQMFSYPVKWVRQVIKKVLGYNNELAVLDLLFEEKIKKIAVFEKYVMIHGICSNYYFENNGLYDFDKCWEHIQAYSDVIGDFQYKYGKVTCINTGLCSDQKVFTLIINNGEYNLEYYVESYYRDNIDEIKLKKDALSKIFDQKKSFLVSGSHSIKLQPFIQAVLNEYLRRYNRVCELVHLTQIQEGKYVSERYELISLFDDPMIYEDFIRKLKCSKYDWIIIPIMAYHESVYSEIGINRLIELETTAKNNNVSIVFYTDFTEQGLTIMTVTEQALSFVDYVICLNEDNDRHVFVEKIREVTEDDLG